MKKRKVLSLCVVIAIVFGLFSSCANPPGSQTYTYDIPQPADQLSTEDMNTESDPVDMSELTEDELGKINVVLSNTLKNLNKDDTVTVTLYLHKTLESSEVRELALERETAQKDALVRLNSELETLKQSYDDKSISNGKKIAVSKRIDEISKEIADNNTPYDKIVSQIHDEIDTPILEDVIADFDIKVPHELFINNIGPCIYYSLVTAQTVVEMAKDERIRDIYKSTEEYEDVLADIEEMESHNLIYPSVSTSSSSSEQYSSTKVNEIYDIIDGEIAINNNKKGDGVTIVLIDGDIPDPTLVPNVIYYDSIAGEYGFREGYVGVHSTDIARAIYKMVPNCQIISICAPGGVVGGITASIKVACNLLEDVDIISISLETYEYYENGIVDYGKYTDSTGWFDYYAIEYNTPLVLAAGNSGGYVSELGIAPNTLCVGAVQHYGTNPEVLSPFRNDYKSAYRQFDGDQTTKEKSMINKPDFCAPGDIYSNSEDAYTSYSVPFVTGTIAQMMSTNSNYTKAISSRKCSLLIKATLMASCFYNAGLSSTIYGNSISSNKEGSGVINAGACYDTAANSKYSYYNFDSLENVTKSIYIHDTSKPLRVAIAWNVEPIYEENDFNNTEFNLYVYKDGASVPIGRSYAQSYLNYNSMDFHSGPVTNYEYVEIPASTLASKGTGLYTAKIIVSGTESDAMNTDVAIAWSQYVNTDA